MKKKPVIKHKWKGVRKKTVESKRNDKPGKITTYRLFGKASEKYKDKVYASSISLVNPKRGIHSLELWSNMLDRKPSIKGLQKLVKPGKGVGKPKKCTIVVVQRNRVKPHRFGYTNYMSGEAMKITERNVKSFIVGVLQGHEENIRQSIVRRGYPGRKYDEGNFRAWHVPYIDVNIHYTIPKLK